jgi:glyoxylase-like metal-dependent hydrolase (beta-lactamase superfamily II)
MSHDWTTPGAYPVAPGVHRIPLPLPQDGLCAVNAYLIEDSDGPVLVDPGWAGPDNLTSLTDGLKELGHRPEDLAQVVVTHAHWDHYTQALLLSSELGVPVRLGAGERPSIDAYDPTHIAYPRQARQLLRCGAVELAARFGRRPPTDQEQSTLFTAPDTWVEDGQSLPLADRQLEAIATPGHTRGHIVLRDSAAGLLFAGDHVLPHITPSLGLERLPEPRPLRSYLDSLALLRGQPDLLLLPAHGPVTPSAHTRIDELLAHHEQRLAAVVAQVHQGRDDAFSIAEQLPWTRRSRRLHDLDDINQMLAVLEIQAHLDVLADAGAIQHVATDTTDLYVPA